MAHAIDLGSDVTKAERMAIVRPPNKRLLRAKNVLRRLDGWAPLVVVFILLILAAAPQWFTWQDPYRVNISASLLPPSATHWMGTDDVGRDIYTRLVYGTRYSLGMGAIVVIVSSIVGLALGGAAGFFGKWVDESIMRFTDIVMGFPSLLFAMVISSLLGASLSTAIIATAVIWWPSYVRLVRGQVLSVVNEVYIEAARSVGMSNWRIVSAHVLPNSWSPILARAATDIGRTIIFVGSLSFIGLGAEPPLPEWGTMLSEARVLILGAWWYITFPGIAITLTVLSFGMLGDTLDEILRPL